MAEPRAQGPAFIPIARAHPIEQEVEYAHRKHTAFVLYGLTTSRTSTIFRKLSSIPRKDAFS